MPIFLFHFKEIRRFPLDTKPVAQVCEKYVKHAEEQAEDGGNGGPWWEGVENWDWVAVSFS